MRLYAAMGIRLYVAVWSEVLCCYDCGMRVYVAMGMGVYVAMGTRVYVAMGTRVMCSKFPKPIFIAPANNQPCG